MIVSIYLDVGLAVLVSMAAFTDLSNRRIPNLLLLIGFSSAILLHLLSVEPFTAMLSGLTGAIIGLVIFMPFYCMGGMAAGDIKFMAVIGFFSTPISILHIALITVLLGGIFSLVVVINNFLMLYLPWLLRILQIKPNITIFSRIVSHIPYGVAIAGGTWLVLLESYIGR